MGVREASAELSPDSAALKSSFADGRPSPPPPASTSIAAIRVWPELGGGDGPEAGEAAEEVRRGVFFIFIFFKIIFYRNIFSVS